MNKPAPALVPLERNELSTLALLQFANSDPDEVVARRTGISRSQFSKLKLSRLLKVTPEVKRLAKFYNTSPESLLGVWDRSCIRAMLNSVR